MTRCDSCGWSEGIGWRVGASTTREVMAPWSHAWGNEATTAWGNARDNEAPAQHTLLDAQLGVRIKEKGSQCSLVSLPWWNTPIILERRKYY